MLQHGLGEEDPQALLRRGDALMRSPGFFSSLLGRGADPDAACSCYMQAAQRFKVTKKWNSAADAYARAAAAAQRAGDEPRAASLLVEAGSTLKRADTEGARQQLDAAAAAYIRLGRWGSAGKVYRSIAEMLETEPRAAAAERQASLGSCQAQQQHQPQQQPSWGASDGRSSSSSGRRSLLREAGEGRGGGGAAGGGGSSPATAARADSRSTLQQKQPLQQQQRTLQQQEKDEGPLQGEQSGLDALYYYKKAAEAYDLDDYGRSACSQCRVKYAELAAKDDALLHEAIRIYEEEGEKATKSDLLQFSARDFFFRAILLLLSTGDVVSAKIAMERYNMRDPRLENSREGQLAAALVAAAEDGDADAFTAALHDYDRISKLDSWKVHFLLRAKRKLLLDGGPAADEEEADEGAENAFIGEDGHVDLS